MLLVFAAIVSIIGYKTFTDSMLEQYADDAFKTADAAAMFVSPELLDSGQIWMTHMLPMMITSLSLSSGL